MTQMFFRELATTTHKFSLGTNQANHSGGTTKGWAQGHSFALTRGAGFTTVSKTTVDTQAAEFQDATPNPVHWTSPPLDRDVTIAGTITFNLWMSESNMSANSEAQCQIDRIDSTGAVVSTVVDSPKGIELPVTTRAAQNWTATPTSTVFLKGDRFRVIPLTVNSVGGFAADFSWEGTSAAADGDSYITFTETFDFMTTAPTGSTLYPTTTNAAVDPQGASADSKEVWASRGAGVTNTAGPNLATGWTAPLQVEQTLGTDIEWFSKALAAFTLQGVVLVNVRAALSTGTTARWAPRAELAVCANNGTDATVWAAGSNPSGPTTTTEAAYVFYLAGRNVSVAEGQRLRLRFYADDLDITAMVAGANTARVYYAGTSGGASGDTFLTFGQTLEELRYYGSHGFDFPTPEWDPAGEFTAAAAAAAQYVIWLG